MRLLAATGSEIRGIKRWAGDASLSQNTNSLSVLDSRRRQLTPLALPALETRHSECTLPPSPPRARPLPGT